MKQIRIKEKIIDYAKQKVKQRDKQWIKEIHQLKMTTYPNPLDTLMEIMEKIEPDFKMKQTGTIKIDDYENYN